jgi:hypothetical protein
MSLIPTGVKFPDKQEPGKGRIAEIRSIIKNIFVNVVEDGWRGRDIEPLKIPNYKIARVPPNPNVGRGKEYPNIPNCPVYVVCPADFPTVEYSYDGSRTVFDYSKSVEESQFKHFGKSSAYEPKAFDPTVYSATGGSFDGFSAPSYDNSDGTGSNGEGWTALAGENGEMITETRTDIHPEYVVVLLGMAGVRTNQIRNYHGIAVVKE